MAMGSAVKVPFVVLKIERATSDKHGAWGVYEIIEGRKPALVSHWPTRIQALEAERQLNREEAAACASVVRESSGLSLESSGLSRLNGFSGQEEQLAPSVDRRDWALEDKYDLEKEDG